MPRRYRSTMNWDNRFLLALLLVASISIFSAMYLYLPVIDPGLRMTRSYVVPEGNEEEYIVRQNSSSMLEALLKDLLTEGYFPWDVEEDCPYLSVRKIPYAKHNDEPTRSRYCKLRTPTKDECKQAVKSYKVGEEPLKCSDETKPTSLCTVAQKRRESPMSMVNVLCDTSACGSNPLYVANIDPVYGVLESKEKWKRFVLARELEVHLSTIIIENTINGFNFCFIQCLAGDQNSRIIKTIFMFPPVTSGNKKESPNLGLFNINVVVLDSVSRPHAYRSLPKTIQTLKDIVYDSSSNSTVLDYQFIQGLAPYTFVNLKAFFTGSTRNKIRNGKSSGQDYGVEVLYEKLKEKGFYTLLQEDSCWYDSWGIVLSNGMLVKKVESRGEMKARWIRLNEHIRKCKIDDTGPTHASCVVFQQYNKTNQFNKPNKLCYGGKTLVSYFLEYVESTIFRYSENDTGHNVFAYTHLSIGHEVTGMRVKQGDERLAEHLKMMAADQNTLTILFSDHGPKTTEYSFHSTAGMYEVYAPFLFIILPEEVAQKLGKRRVKALITNQHRLLTLADINAGLTSYLFAQDLENPSNYRNEGIFNELLENRTCEELPMQLQALCVCRGREKWFPDNYRNFYWIAEFAIGELNNKIQTKFQESNSIGGFGSCQRLVGYKFTKVHQKRDDKNYFVTMNIHVWPLKEIFEVSVKYPIIPPTLRTGYKKKRKLARLLHRRRVTVYKSFFACKDSTVPVALCVCKVKQVRVHAHRKTTSNWKWIKMNSRASVYEVMNRSINQRAQQRIEDLDNGCLHLITRDYGNRKILAYEIGNSCSDKTYSVRIEGRSVCKIITSVSIPTTVQVPPFTVYFAFTVFHFRKPHDFTPIVSFQSRQLKA